MKKLVALICRHGETTLNSGNKFRSWLDVPLDENGTRQAKEMANFLMEFPITRVIASPLLRTITTAHEYADRVKLPVEQNRGLLPWHMGVLAGRDKTDEMPVLKLFVHNPTIKLPGGESLEGFESRAGQFYSTELFDKHKDGGLPCLFGHTSSITVLEGLLKGERGEPDASETVKPGGVCGIFQTDVWFEVEPIFGKVEEANYGS